MPEVVLNFSELEFRMTLSQIPKFEKFNNISCCLDFGIIKITACITQTTLKTLYSTYDLK